MNILPPAVGESWVVIPMRIAVIVSRKISPHSPPFSSEAFAAASLLDRRLGLVSH